jgi:thioredoxin-dependent peroxiredoxin
MSSMPAEGDPAPPFDLEASTGGRISLKSLKGKPVVLYFYPKDDTPGCTAEACAFRDMAPQYEFTGAVVLGVSPDNVASHNKFAEKYGLKFPLLADPDHAVCEAYGVWGEKKNYGKTYMGVTRATFVIDSDGDINRIWPKVKVEGHADEVLAALRPLA